ncbi:unnamed protein product [Gongylonema pulchrum]|uniref:Transposase n=1 Tax=Gongylonema pulchrum TaxID=637853 RepID=A0A183EGW3_9BILA|nr:unnamed protein product [Gongylonema pulchrum]
MVGEKVQKMPLQRLGSCKLFTSTFRFRKKAAMNLGCMECWLESSTFQEINAQRIAEDFLRHLPPAQETIVVWYVAARNCINLT